MSLSDQVKTPFVIDCGSVAVGKSTTARILQELLTRWPSSPKVDLVTTDGFLYPNAVLNVKTYGAEGLFRKATISARCCASCLPSRRASRM